MQIFLEKPYYSHDFENVEYSNENFDRACNLKDLHTVKRKVEYKLKNYDTVAFIIIIRVELKLIIL